MNENERKNITMWFFFTLLFGMLPMIFLCLTSFIKDEFLSLGAVSKEMFFLTIILCADILKTLYDVDNKHMVTTKTISYSISIFILVISSVLYGITLIFGEENVNFNIVRLSAVLCGFSIGIGFITQILISKKSKNYTEEEKGYDK